MKTGTVLGVIVVVVAFLLTMVLTVALPVMEAAKSQPSDEYYRYIQIRDASNCTKTNDSYCMEQCPICIHCYQSCQEQRCSGASPWPENPVAPEETVEPKTLGYTYGITTSGRTGIGIGTGAGEPMIVIDPYDGSVEVGIGMV